VEFSEEVCFILRLKQWSTKHYSIQKCLGTQTRCNKRRRRKKREYTCIFLNVRTLP